MHSAIHNKQRAGRKQAVCAAFVVLCACGWLAVQLSAAQKEAKPEAVFTVQPVKQSYSEGEAVLLLLGLQNTGQRAIVVDANFALGRTVRVRITGPQGKSIDWQSAFPERTPGFQTLEPGGSVTRIVCLNCRSRDPFDYPFDQTGSYTIRLDYEPFALTAAEHSRFPRAVALSHTVEATPFKLQVTPPVLQFTAKPAKPTFDLGDAIRFVFHLHNTGSQGVLVAYDLALLDAVHLKVVDANGKEVPWSGQQHNAVPLLSMLDPGSSVESGYAITPQNLFGTVLRGIDIRKAGTYTVYATYDLAEPINELQGYVGMTSILLVPGPIAAPPVKFTVVAPPSQKKQ